MAGIERRVGALEEYLNRRVEERIEVKLDAMLDLLEERLSREEFVKVLHKVAEECGVGA